MTALGATDKSCKEVTAGTVKTKYCVCDKDGCNSASTQSIVQIITMIIASGLMQIVFA